MNDRKPIGYVEATVRFDIYDGDKTDDRTFDWFEYSEPGITSCGQLSQSFHNRSPNMAMNDGVSAYPFTGCDEQGQFIKSTGMSMRQAYKVAAVQGLLTFYGSQREISFKKISFESGSFADAMLAEDAAFAARKAQPD